MNTTISRLTVAQTVLLSPSFSVANRNSLSYFQHVSYMRNFGSFFYSRFDCKFGANSCSFAFLLDRVATISQMDYLNRVFSSRIIPSSSCTFSKCSFRSISSNGDGGAIFFNVAGQIMINVCVFSDVITSASCGAIYIGSSCTKAIINRACMNKCSAENTHGFKIDCTGSQISSVVVTYCASTEVGAWGSLWFNAKPSLVCDINSTYNSISNHGAGIWFEYCPGFVASRLHIEGCVSKGVVMLRESKDFQIQYMNFVRNRNTNDALLYITLSSSFMNCAFFYNINGFLNNPSLATFSNCIFDFNKVSGANYQITNMFNAATYTMINQIVPHSGECIIVNTNYHSRFPNLNLVLLIGISVQ